jgi:hypothetical protein
MKHATKKTFSKLESFVVDLIMIQVGFNKVSAFVYN